MNNARHDEVSASRRRSLRRVLLSALAAVTLISVAAVVAASPANAATSQFKGFNWSRNGDNFTTGTHVLDGLSSSDSYSTVMSKANSIYNGFAAQGANTVRLPINTQDTGTSWWNAYRGTIDAAT